MKSYLADELFKEDWQKELAVKAIPKCLNEKYRKFRLGSFSYYDMVKMVSGQSVLLSIYQRIFIKLDK